MGFALYPNQIQIQGVLMHNGLRSCLEKHTGPSLYYVRGRPYTMSSQGGGGVQKLPILLSKKTTKRGGGGG